MERFFYGANYAYSSSYSTKEAAENEIKDLSVNDPLVRMTLQECRIEDAEVRNEFQSMSRFDLYIDTPMENSVEFDKVHDRWSEFLANCGFIIRDEDTIEACCASLEETFRYGP